MHNVTAATRLFDVLPLLADDPRVQVLFTCPESSAFHGRLSEYFSERGVTPIAWQPAVQTPFDLAIAASHGGPLHELQAPLVVLPHGMGYNKYLLRKSEAGHRKSEIGHRKPVFGLSPEWLLHEGRVIATSLVLSHSEQLDRLRRYCPEAAEVAVVAGDPSFDRVLASLPLRHLYREALGVRDPQRLILISSTWGDTSLYGRQPDLAQRLRAELPLDDYAVAVALHPNAWSFHSPWQIHRWLHTAARSGVIVFPAHEGWRAGLVAADVVIGDQGSVTFYGASLGRQVILAEAPDETVDPASPIGRFLAAAPKLRSADPLRSQVEAALDATPGDEIRAIADLTTSAPLKSHSLLRTEFYRLLNLPEPDGPAEASALPIPEASGRTAATQSVQVTLDQAGDLLRAAVERLPAELLLRGRPLDVHAHLVVSTDEPSETALQLADVIVHGEPGEATVWITETLRASPGATVAARPIDDTTWLAGTRDGHRVRFGQTGTFGAALASVALAWTAKGEALRTFPGRVELIIGGVRHHVTATPSSCCC
ncbi:hypothetical protein [Lentzea sp. E54]|uniref:hypothetical protein n=1 Tax=Lentzea xerophila TaxID=3435883 RepID=UPI003DA453F5